MTFQCSDFPMNLYSKLQSSALRFPDCQHVFKAVYF